jgi:hypothetical protein
MKKTIITKILLSLLLTGFFSCEKIDVPKDTPSCIKKKIKEKKEECLDKVLEYEYNGNNVYLFEPANCPDALFNLYDENCNHICSPAGGISGNGDGKCNDFYQTSVEKRLIWSKK